MKQKKKIDDIYREGLQNVGTPPPADSWDIINARLSEEKKNRVLPLWIKWGGVAAVIALLLGVFNFTIFNNSLSEPVVNQEKIEPALEIPSKEESRISDMQAKEENNSDDNFGKSASEKITAKPSASKTLTVQNPIIQENTSFSSSEVKAKTNKLTPDPLATETSGSKVAAINNNITSPVAEDHLTRVRETGKISVVTEPVADAAEVSKRQNETEILNPSSNDLKNQLLKEETGLAESKPEPLNSKDESFLKRIRVSTTAGAVYFDVGNGSTVDEQFAGNAGGSEVSMAYGVNIAYKLSDRVKIRSGVSKVNMNYSTRQVDYSSAMSSSAAASSEPAGMGIMLSGQGSLDQEFGFIEVPLEMEFTLIDKKIGLNLIGGASTLFLDENRLAMTTSNFTTDLGEAQNLNELSFSANLGVGLHYKFAPQFRLNLEPIFKYQLNTFNHSSGLNPYYFGIYSGISYQF